MQLRDILDKETIVCVSPTSWGSLWRNRQQIMWRLAKKYRIIFVEPQRNHDFALFVNLKKKALSFLKNTQLQGVGSFDRELWLLESPPAIPYMLAMTRCGCCPSWVRAIAWMNCFILNFAIRRALKRLGTYVSILWLYEPFHQPLIKLLNAKLNIFYVYDETAEFISNRKVAEVIKEYDEILTQQADLVFVTSRPKYKKRLLLNKHTYLIPNGVDFELFNRAAQSDCEPAPETVRIKRPIAGFVGWLGFQIDAELLLYASSHLRDWSFVLVGPDSLSNNGVAKELRRKENVYFLGNQPLEKLPHFLAAFDVGLMPYLVNSHMSSGYPLKFNEYLAAGLPVVATSLPALSEFKDLINLTDSPDEFVKAITQAAQIRDETQITKRIAFARQNTWDERVEDIDKVLTQFKDYESTFF